MSRVPSAPRTVCVLGFHRSGTSLTARVLNVLGVDLGNEEDLLAAGEVDNPRGYWEPRWMNDLNDELLGVLGTKWWEPFPGTPGWEQSSRLDPLRVRAAELLEQKLGHAELGGWKDPRTTLTLPFWRDLVPEPRYVICLRNPIDAVASIQRRPEPTRSVRHWHDLWLEYTARALYETAGSPRMFVFYEDFFDDGPALIERLADFIGAPLSGGDHGRRAAAMAVAEASLRRHTTSVWELAADTGVPAPTRATFLALRAAEDLLRRGSQSSTAHNDDRLDRAIARTIPDLWWAGRAATDALAAATEHERQTVGELEQQLARERDSRTAETQQLRTALEARTEEAAAAVEHARQLTDQRVACEHQLDVTQRALSTIYNSLSWRMTAPLRALKQRMRPRRR